MKQNDENKNSMEFVKKSMIYEMWYSLIVRKSLFSVSKKSKITNARNKTMKRIIYKRKDAFLELLKITTFINIVREKLQASKVTKN